MSHDTSIRYLCDIVVSNFSMPDEYLEAVFDALHRFEGSRELCEAKETVRLCRFLANNCPALTLGQYMLKNADFDPPEFDDFARQG